MFKPRNIVMGLIGVAALMASTQAEAGAASFMPRGEGIGAPAGFADLCRRDIETCGLPAAQLAFLGGQNRQTFVQTSSMSLNADASDTDLKLAAVETIEAYTVGPVEDFVAAGLPRTFASLEESKAVPTWYDHDERDQMKLLNKVNQQVNRDVRKANDSDLYGQEEYWALPRLIDGKLYGDCEDFALEKRRQLIAAGVPESSLSLAVAVTARGEGHAVLMVSLKSGDWVLDNLTPWATPWADLNYRWVQRQVPGTALWTSAA
ncbi:putative transglutaminase-like cysteine proteinase [Caulobacter sp. BE264]|uniref:transglutaminase-like cysteine peptidase n=1 Tax=Caulobacter sp. BE264 TaxID=2817724 RepID=UPI0028636999|nr:transglutaminase-like cysteine peptidase [Caulobacter sp. BE264]MDR7230973.1 putative transglutaminase-like cysteine proteinase [Caulobacter sp. BE264]